MARSAALASRLRNSSDRVMSSGCVLWAKVFRYIGLSRFHAAPGKDASMKVPAARATNAVAEISRGARRIVSGGGQFQGHAHDQHRPIAAREVAQHAEQGGRAGRR